MLVGMKDTRCARVGDTWHLQRRPVEALPGFKPAKSMVFAGGWAGRGGQGQAVLDADADAVLAAGSCQAAGRWAAAPVCPAGPVRKGGHWPVCMGGVKAPGGISGRAWPAAYTARNGRLTARVWAGQRGGRVPCGARLAPTL